MIGEYDSGYESCIDTMVRQIEGMQYRIDLMAHDNAALRAKNKKMRELVQDMFRDFADADYELKARHGRAFMAVTRYEPRLRELGIEVK